ncbi:uncharacterized protein BP01DRAFT_228975 [Aspergillus saccharolyticus JOP 1030-1]|uniref:Serine-threonine rich protein n=1 Tax=Aspergillus saccharolyticus JOP 1030-1 TaxID=1450539 RepID=A0A318ZK32_9EURO|nr:hypothetical protein BP01DRAFT_228975 [Aspergillus saccharolyticus JOP 1030-1]PYH47207.1 hypothetical protein BP01DRAFT_228975 [Aspergillus saccharolyticus JOP 1030-1]
MGYRTVSLHISVARRSRPLTGTYPLALLVLPSRLAKSSSQSRQIWGCSQNNHSNSSFYKKYIHEHQRLGGPRMRGKPPHRFRRLDTIFEYHQPWWYHPVESDQPCHKKKHLHRHPDPIADFWDTEGNRTRRMIDRVKREIEKDPYAALFGRRLEPLKTLERLDDTFTSICRSFFGRGHDSPGTADKPLRSENATATREDLLNTTKKSRRTKADNTSIPVVTTANKNVTRYEFDPVSGRMVARKVEKSDGSQRLQGGIEPAVPAASITSISETTGYLSPVHRQAAESEVQGSLPLEKLDEKLMTDLEPWLKVPDDKLQQIPPMADAGIAQTDGSDHSEPPGEASPNSLESASGPIERAASESPQLEGISESPVDKSSKSFLRHDAHQEVPQQQSYSEHRDSALEAGNIGVTDRLEVSNIEVNQSKDDPTELHAARREQEDDLESLSASKIRASYLKIDADLNARISEESNDSKGIVNTETSCADQNHETIILSKDHRPEAPVEVFSVTSDNLGSDSPKVSSEDADVSLPSASEEVQETAKPPSSPSSFPQNIPHQGTTAELYRVLAFDPISLSISEAETSSSYHVPDETAHPTEVLNRLNNPAKFLPYFEKLNNDGFEIVSGGGDVLVFRKARDPVGFVGKKSKTDVGDVTQLPSSSPNVLYQDEDHDFEPGQSKNPTGNTHASASQRNKSSRIVRKMLLGGVATAGTCYAIGVVTSYFRTGGEDGRGIDGFTAFESERRHLN